MNHIVKRKGHKEAFDEKKLYASVYAACMTLRMENEEAETIAQMVTDEVKTEIKDEKEVTSDALQKAAAKCLTKYHPDAAYLYKTHRDVS
jgi:transcriptional regulator NrdR family protein